MQQVPSSELKNRFGAVVKQAQSGAVEITRRGEPVAILLSPEVYEKMGGDRARLLAVMARNHQVAAENGLTQEILDQILNEEE